MVSVFTNTISKSYDNITMEDGYQLTTFNNNKAIVFTGKFTESPKGTMELYIVDTDEGSFNVGVVKRLKSSESYITEMNDFTDGILNSITFN